MVTVLSGSGTTTAEARLHLAPATGAGHAFAPLLPAEATDRVTPPDVPGMDDGCHDDQEAAAESKDPARNPGGVFAGGQPWVAAAAPRATMMKMTAKANDT